MKIGHHACKPDSDDHLYPMGTSFSNIAAEHGNARFLIIESNRILEEITPECAIYLPAENPKPSAEIAMKKADIIRGEAVPASKIAVLAEGWNAMKRSSGRLWNCRADCRLSRRQ